jgi:hypothetical protein
MPPIETIETTLARIDERVEYISERLDTFVSKAEFDPVRRVVYSFVAALLLAVVAAVASIL